MICRLASFVVAALLLVSVASGMDAYAQSARVRTACTADAKRLCPKYKANSPELRYCMESRGRSLSRGCILALEDDGIVPRGTYSRGKSGN